MARGKQRGKHNSGKKPRENKPYIPKAGGSSSKYMPDNLVTSKHMTRLIGLELRSSGPPGKREMALVSSKESATEHYISLAELSKKERPAVRVVGRLEIYAQKRGGSLPEFHSMVPEGMECINPENTVTDPGRLEFDFAYTGGMGVNKLLDYFTHGKKYGSGKLGVNIRRMGYR